MRVTIKSMTIIILVFIALTFAVSMSLLNSNKILKNFSIISVENISTKYTVKYERVKAAVYYKIIVYDSDSSIIYVKKTENTTNIINLKDINYDKKYKLIVFAYDKVGDSISVNNPYSFTYDEPTFSENNDLELTNNTDYILKIDGDLTKDNYLIKVFDNNKEVKSEKLISNNYTIPNSLFTNSQKSLVVKIMKSEDVIDSIELFSNISPITNLKITNPTNESVLDFNDVTFTYTGGDNATKYLLQIYKDNNLLKETEVTKNKCVISSEFFSKSETYRIQINALYKDYSNYTKSASVSFSMNEKDTLKPAYIDRYYKYVKDGTKISILNPNSDGVIYYTIDGSDPSVKGIEYTSPIVVTKNMVLKTIIKEPKKNDSIVSSFNINVGTKDAYKVYLSPSNQTGNMGVASVGYTNESAEMNDLANYVQSRLEKYNVKIYRNTPQGNINLWNSESMYYGCDIHLALHSNASDDGSATGIETWVDGPNAAAYSIANMIQSNLMDIYYKPDGEGNRGVKYANGALGEVNEKYVSFGLLIEVAYHDNKDDAQWILVNKKLIGNTIADSILKYFGIID